jgi:2Fe-2S ferredoxin
MPKLIVIDEDGNRREFDVAVGKTIMQIVRENGYDLEGACEGALACATCHVHVDAQWYGKLGSVSENELDMLDFADEPSSTSRLSCQIEMCDELDGLIVTVPREP